VLTSATPRRKKAIQEGVDGLELRMGEADLDQGREMVDTMPKALQIAHAVGHQVRRRRDEGRLAQGAPARADPVLTSAHVSGRQPTAAHALQQARVDLADQAEQIQQLRDEIAVLKGQKAKPRFKPSGMDTETEPGGDAEGSAASDGGEDGGSADRSRKRRGSTKRRKTQQLTIHETRKVPPQAPIPAGSRFKGYRDFVVQDLRIVPHNTRYRREVWQTPHGERLLGAVPAELNGGHFGPQLRRYVLYQAAFVCDASAADGL
jgi:hypothetical protein